MAMEIYSGGKKINDLLTNEIECWKDIIGKMRRERDDWKRQWIASSESLTIVVKERDKYREAIERALADAESGKGWGPDVTVCQYLREAIGK